MCIAGHCTRSCEEVKMDIEMHEVKEASDEVALFDEESSAQVKRKEPAMTRRRVLIYAGVLILAIAVLAGVLVAGVTLGRNWDKVFRTSCSFSPSFQTLFAAEVCSLLIRCHCNLVSE